jgi:hypothetical protein
MRREVLFAVVLVVAGGVAACGGGGGVSGGVPATPGSYVVSGGTQTLGSAQTITIPSNNGISGTISFPAGTGTVQYATSTTTPSGVVSIQSADQRSAQIAAANSAILYITYSATTGPVTLSGIPGAAITFSSAPTGTVYEAQGTLSGTYSYWQTLGVLSVSGATVTLPARPGSVTIPQGSSLFIAVYIGNVLQTPAAHPATVGNTFSFTGTLTKTTTYNYPATQATAIPTSVASGQPPLIQTATVSTTITVQATPAPTFSTGAGTVDFHTAETDAYDLQSNVSATDAWYGLDGAGTQFLYYGSAIADNANDTYTNTYGTAQIVDQLPETNGSWTNSPAGTFTENDADGTAFVRAVSADGSYLENSTIPDALTLAILVNSNGSGSYGGSAYVTFKSKTGLTFSAPASGVITVQVVATTAPAPTGTATAKPTATPLTVATPAAWFSPSPKLYGETDTMQTGVSFPGSCSVPAKFGTSGNQLVQAIDRIDPVLGYTELETITTYLQPGVGPACVVLSDNQTYYYDYNDDDGTITGYANVFGTGGVKSTQVISETVTLQDTNAIVPTSSGRDSAQALSGPSAAAVAYVRARFDAVIQHQRRARIDAMYTFLQHALQNRGGASQ